MKKKLVTPKNNALCGMTKCYVMNSINGMVQQTRVLLDSRANLSLINHDVARKIGLLSDSVNINLNVAGKGLSVNMLKRSLSSWSA